MWAPKIWASPPPDTALIPPSPLLITTRDSLPRYNTPRPSLYSAIREKPTSNPVSNRDSSRPDTRTRVIVSFLKG